MKFFNFLLLIFDSVFRFHSCFRDSVSGFRIPCFSAAASCGSAYGMGGGRGGGRMCCWIRCGFLRFHYFRHLVSCNGASFWPEVVKSVRVSDDQSTCVVQTILFLKIWSHDVSLKNPLQNKINQGHEISSPVLNREMNDFSFYSATGETVNTLNISGMFIVLQPITEKIRTCEQSTKQQTNKGSCLRFSFLTPDRNSCAWLAFFLHDILFTAFSVWL